MTEQSSTPARRMKSLQDTAFMIGLAAVVAVFVSAVILHGCVWVTTAIWGRGSVDVRATANAFKRSWMNPASGYDVEVAPPVVIYVLFAAVIIGSAWGTFVVATKIGRHRHVRTLGLTTTKDLSAMLYENQITVAERIMPAQVVKDHGLNAALVLLGTYDGKKLWGLVEDAYVTLAPARSGKTSCLVIPWILDAPGPVITTSTKNDVPMTTIQARERRGGAGSVIVADPSDILGWHNPLRWDPVAGCEVPDEALARGKAWGSTASLGHTGGNGAWFAQKAGTILAYYLHAASVKVDGSMRDVLRWSTDFGDDEPIMLLRSSQALDGVDWANQLVADTRGGAAETISSIQMTISGLTAALLSPAAMDMVCPSPQDRFDLDDFLSGPNTLYLLAPKDLPIAPIFTLFLNTVTRAVKAMSQRQRGARLWPALELDLDEMTNMAPLPDMADLLSDSGGRGITVKVFCQTRAQLVDTYGERGSEAILGNANAQLYLSGIQELDLLDEISKKTTPHDHHRLSVTSNSGAGSSTSTPEERPMMSVDVIRRMTRSEALMFYRNLKAAKIELTPWWEREDAAQLQEDVETMIAMTGRAIE